MTDSFTTSPLFERVERARRRTRKIRETHITLAHGSGGRAMHDLAEGLFLEYFKNPLLEKLEDQAIFEIPAGAKRFAFTTDSYVVDPIFFPGADIGSLAVHGTVNDLAVSGARPLYLSAGFIIEEGLPIEDLRKICASMQKAAVEANVQIVTGDTKVVQKGSADKIFIPGLAAHASLICRRANNYPEFAEFKDFLLDDAFENSAVVQAPCENILPAFPVLKDTA